MCGTIKHEGVARAMGTLFVVREFYSGSHVQSNWSGFIRHEKISWWSTQSMLDYVHVPAHSFTEGKYELSVPASRLTALITRDPVILNGKCISPAGSFRIVTRPALTQFEQDLHDRWPRVVSTTPFALFQWTKKELISGQYSGHDQMSLL